jgi:hypothetical protein
MIKIRTKFYIFFPYFAVGPWPTPVLPSSVIADALSRRVALLSTIHTTVVVLTLYENYIRKILHLGRYLLRFLMMDAARIAHLYFREIVRLHEFQDLLHRIEIQNS